MFKVFFVGNVNCKHRMRVLCDEYLKQYHFPCVNNFFISVYHNHRTLHEARKWKRNLTYKVSADRIFRPIPQTEIWPDLETSE